MGQNQIQTLELNSIKDNKKFDINAVEILYSLRLNSFTLINDDKNNIYLAKTKNFTIQTIEKDKKLDEFKTKQNSNIKNNILNSYDQHLSKKYEVVLNQKTIERVKNFFKWLSIETSKILSFDIEAKNQIIYTAKKIKGDQEILNLIDNFLNEKNSFIFESVEKGKIRGRYTIFGKNPDKIWEFNNKNSYVIKNNKKIKLRENPENLIEK